MNCLDSFVESSDVNLGVLAQPFDFLFVISLKERCFLLNQQRKLVCGEGGRQSGVRGEVIVTFY